MESPRVDEQGAAPDSQAQHRDASGTPVSGTPMRGLPSGPRLSLAARIVWLVLGSTLCMALVSTWVSGRAVGRFARTYVDEALPVPLGPASRSIEDWYDEREVDLLTLSRSVLLEAYLRRPSRQETAQVRDFLGFALARSEAYAGFALLEAQDHGAWRSVLDVSRDGSDVSSVTGGARSGVDPGEASVAAVHFEPVQLREGARTQSGWIRLPGPRAVWLVARLDLAELDALLQSSPHWTAAELSLLEADGRVLASSSPGRIGERRSAAALREEQGTRPVRSYRGDSGVLELVSTRSVARFGWTLEAAAPAAELLAPARDAVRGTLAVYLAVAALCCAGAFLLALSVVRPLRALCEGVRRLGEGDATPGIEESARDDELGLLVRTFNHMARRLTQQRARIQAVNLDLRARNQELERLNRQLERLSITDGLTGLYNHRYFQEHLTREISRVERSREHLSLVLIDIDNFKQLNDRHGHAAGDAVLREVARVMKALTRESDLLARYGGEEFALVPRQSSLEGAVQIAEKIRLGVAEVGVPLPAAGTAESGSAPLRVTVSVGIGVYRGHRADFFRAADRALYQAKAQGKDCVVVS